MNHFFLAKKTSFISGICNIVGTSSWIFVILLIWFYHFHFLKHGGRYSFVANGFQIGNFQDIQSLGFAWSYITNKGLAMFFQASFWGAITYWHVISFYSVIGIFCYCVKTIASIFTLVSAIKTKSVIYIHAALMDLFLPLIGGIYSVYIWQNHQKFNSFNRVLPMQWIRFRVKTIFFQLFSDTNLKNL